ncbi:hypothetical protein [Microbacterium oxydans]|uniref:hypothetical protein n=1 Tax=Microbacterium oxydans TaxID=82380 RepID=UPI00226B8DEF|nr:hypothetical protein [Microbacterium oxydans]WAA65632.1 hypothetical protein MME74_15575 [Microbacterium oxydans]
MAKLMEREQVWPSLGGGWFAPRGRERRSAAPLEQTEPVGAYAAYLAWLEVEARAAAELGAHAA